MFQFSQLRCFVAAATELHFGRAAERLNMTQPPLSRQIQLLEHELGVELLVRGRRSVRLTSAGRAFLPEAEDLLKRAEAAALSARRALRGEAGSVTLGFIPAAGYGFLPRLVAAARERLPDIDLILRELTTSEQEEGLAAKRIDLGLIRPLRTRPDIETLRVMRDPFVLALPPRHPFAERDRIALRDLDRQSFIMYSPAEGRYSYEILAGVFRASGVEPAFVQFLFQTHTILSLVAAGLGVALVPASAQEAGSGRIVFKPIDAAGAATELHAAWLRTTDSAAAARLRGLMSEMAV